ncbi:MAG: hypothetical protein CMB80_16375 [Flammeovirgaceae bacterium]|nr:hypothetical protein [Flammeovirgaceae bacterium]
MSVEIIVESSRTYKFKAEPIVKQAMYFTIGGYPTPKWFFLNSKSMESFQWIIALMTSYSIQLKDNGDIDAIIS